MTNTTIGSIRDPQNLDGKRVNNKCQDRIPQNSHPRFENITLPQVSQCKTSEESHPSPPNDNDNVKLFDKEYDPMQKDLGLKEQLEHLVHEVENLQEEINNNLETIAHLDQFDATKWITTLYFLRIKISMTTLQQNKWEQIQLRWRILRL